jgi:hypoxia up-regulated 1
VEEAVTEEANVMGDAFAKFGSTLSKLFSSSETGDGTPNETDEAVANATAQNATSASNATDSNQADPVNGTQPQTANDTSSEKNATGEVKTEIKIKALKEPLKIEINNVDLPDINPDEFAKSQKKLQDLNEIDLAKLKRDSARNGLESFVSETKMKLYETEYESASTEADREAILKEMNAASEWLEYESDNASYEDFKSKLTSLKALTNALFERVQEHKGRPEAMKALNDMLNISTLFLNSAKSMSSDQQIFTDVEISTLDKLVTGTGKWITESEEAQEKLPLNVAPKITIKQIAEKIGALDREVKYLVNKLKITPPKKKVEPKVEEEETTTEKPGDESAPASEDDVVKQDDTETNQANIDSDTVTETAKEEATASEHSETTEKPDPSKPVPEVDDEHTEL